MKRFVDYPEYNKFPISTILDKYLFGRRDCSVLELAGGSGQHASYFGRRYAPSCAWTSTDFENTESIKAYTAEVGPTARCCTLDASKPSEWAAAFSQTPTPTAASPLFDMLFVANMTHISPFACTEGLFAGAATHLKSHGRVAIYGPFGRNGVITPESNAKFDASLRQRNPLWGYRDVERDIIPTAEKSGFAVEAIHDMPENNWFLVFKRSGLDATNVAWPDADESLLAQQKANAESAAKAHADSISAFKPADADY